MVGIHIPLVIVVIIVMAIILVIILEISFQILGLCPEIVFPSVCYEYCGCSRSRKTLDFHSTAINSAGARVSPAIDSLQTLRRDVAPV